MVDFLIGQIFVVGQLKFVGDVEGGLGGGVAFGAAGLVLATAAGRLGSPRNASGRSVIPSERTQRHLLNSLIQFGAV